MCKRGNAFSLAVLIGRELDHILLVMLPMSSLLPLYALSSFQGTILPVVLMYSARELPLSLAPVAAGDFQPAERRGLAARAPRKFAPLAQLVEHLTLNQGVPGSNP